MKRILLAACAVLVLIGAADARNRKHIVPTIMVGGWCNDSDGEAHFEASKLEDCPGGAPDFMIITRTGLEVQYGEYEWRCVFDRVEQQIMWTGTGPEPWPNWWVRARCKSNSRGDKYERHELEIRVDDDKPRQMIFHDHYK